MWLDYDDYAGEAWNKPVPTIKRFWFRRDDSDDSKCLTISTIRAMKRFWLNQIFDSVKFDRTFSKAQQAPMVPKNIHVDWISPNARKFNQHAR